MMGNAQEYHLGPLAKCIKKADPNVYIASYGLWYINNDGEYIHFNNSPFFEKIYRIDRKKINTYKQISYSFLKYCFYLYRLLSGILWVCKKNSSLKKIIKNIDVINLQSLSLSKETLWLLLTNHKPLIVSCWGSDVLRNNNTIITFLQKKLLNKATAITLTGIEFQEIVLAKYGRNLEKKIYNTYFNPQIEKFLESDLIDKRNIPNKRVWKICLGHNGFEENNHIQQIASINKLPPEIKSKIELIAPMTYGGNPNYALKVREHLERTGCKFQLLDNFMSEEDVIKLRNSIDILVFTPISDAFSATVTQALAVGSLVITGIWLPYKLRKSSGFHFYEIDSIDQLYKKIQSSIENWEHEVLLIKQNQNIALDVFDEKVLGNNWLNVYEHAKQSFKG